MRRYEKGKEIMKKERKTQHTEKKPFWSSCIKLLLTNNFCCFRHFPPYFKFINVSLIRLS